MNLPVRYIEPRKLKKYYEPESFARYNGRCGICGETYYDRLNHLVTAHGWTLRVTIDGQDYLASMTREPHPVTTVGP